LLPTSVKNVRYYKNILEYNLIAKSIISRETHIIDFKSISDRIVKFKIATVEESCEYILDHLTLFLLGQTLNGRAQNIFYPPKDIMEARKGNCTVQKVYFAICNLLTVSLDLKSIEIEKRDKEIFKEQINQIIININSIGLSLCNENEQLAALRETIFSRLLDKDFFSRIKSKITKRHNDSFRLFNAFLSDSKNKEVVAFGNLAIIVISMLGNYRGFASAKLLLSACINETELQYILRYKVFSLTYDSYLVVTKSMSERIQKYSCLDDVMGYEHISKLNYLNCLVGRSIKPVDAQKEYADRTAPGMIKYGFDGNKFSHIEYKNQRDYALRYYFYNIADLEYIQNTSFSKFYKERYKHIVAGSTEMKGVIRDDIKKKLNRHTQNPEIFSITKRMVHENMGLKQFMTYFNQRKDEPKVIAKEFPKLEVGDKTRAIYAADDIHYTISAYINRGFENAKHFEDIYLKATGSDIIKTEATKNRYNRTHNIKYSFDFSNFNILHSLEDLEAVSNMATLTAEKLNAQQDFVQMCEWTAKASRVQIVDSKDKGRYRVRRGLFSGIRTTTRDNSLLNACYNRVADTFLKKQRLPSNIQRDVHGDDLTELSSSWLNCYYKTNFFNWNGLTGQSSKTLIDTERSEFLRVMTCGKGGLMRMGSLARCLSAFVSGNWITPAVNDTIAEAAEFSNKIALAARRGMPEILARSLINEKEYTSHPTLSTLLHANMSMGGKGRWPLLDSNLFSIAEGNISEKLLVDKQSGAAKIGFQTMSLSDVCTKMSMYMPGKMSKDYVQAIISTKKAREVIGERAMKRIQERLKASSYERAIDSKIMRELQNQNDYNVMKEVKEKGYVKLGKKMFYSNLLRTKKVEDVTLKDLKESWEHLEKIAYSAKLRLRRSKIAAELGFESIDILTAMLSEMSYVDLCNTLKITSTSFNYWKSLKLPDLDKLLKKGITCDATVELICPDNLKEIVYGCIAQEGYTNIGVKNKSLTIDCRSSQIKTYDMLHTAYRNYTLSM
jgi:hypothetical protein